MKTRNATYTSATTITNHKTTIQGKMETNMEKDHDVDYVEEKCSTFDAAVLDKRIRYCCLLVEIL